MPPARRRKTRARSAAVWILLGMLVRVACTAGLSAQEKSPPAEAATPRKGLYGGDQVTGIAGELSSVACDQDDVVWVGAEYFGVFACKDNSFTLFNQAA